MRASSYTSNNPKIWILDHLAPSRTLWAAGQESMFCVTGARYTLCTVLSLTYIIMGVTRVLNGRGVVNTPFGVPRAPSCNRIGHFEDSAELVGDSSPSMRNAFSGLEKPDTASTRYPSFE